MGWQNVVRNGWHPEESGGIRQGVKGLVGRGDEHKRDKEAHNHVSRPINALKDPNSFGPPPKHRDAYGEQAAAASIPTPSTSTALREVRASPTPQASPSVVSQPSTNRPRPAVPPRAGVTGTHRERSTSPEMPTGPFRVDTTGLSTSNLPPPPAHRDRRAVDSKSSSTRPGSTSLTRTPHPSTAVAGSTPPPPVPTRSAVSRPHAHPPPLAKPKPSLPPRSSVAGCTENDSELAESPPPPYSERPNPITNAAPAVSELQQRFARIRARENETDSGGEGGVTRSNPTQESGISTPPPIPRATKPI